ncbi:MAG: nicotinamide riboside transporter PnuC [Chitinophagaceae bacterium]
MSLQHLYQQFTAGMLQTTLLEYIAVFFGIASVWYSRKEDLLVYPVGLVSTVIYIYLSLEGHLVGEASVNLFYTIMSIYGWVLWTRKNPQQQHVVVISNSTRRESLYDFAFFIIIYVALFTLLSISKKYFTPGAIPWADSLASASAFTGMWLMAKKKVESWYWWIATNTASVPLYFVKGYMFTSVFYLVLLVMAFWGLVAWRKKIKHPVHATFDIQ